MIKLNDITLDSLERKMPELGEPRYRARQLFQWFSRGVTRLEEMGDIPKALKEKLSKELGISGIAIEKEFSSRLDETKKYLMRLDDGNIIESVAMKYRHGITACLSTQAGCRMGCAFCASTIGGRSRNLTAGEILGQAALMQSALGQRISNIVLMGIGEPLDNYENVIIFLKNVNNPQGMNIGYRHITLSTCGITEKIYRLAEEDMPITLSVSLHAPNDEIRSRIMPVNKKYPVAQLINACRDYIRATRRRISFEYILIKGVNDLPRHAEELSRLLKGMLCHVNLIPANFVPESGLEGSGRRAVREFQRLLEANNVNATVRLTLGADISASCGQLRERHSGAAGEKGWC